MKNMVTLMEPNSEVFELTAALLLYKSNRSNVYATAHDVVDHPHLAGSKQIGPGAAATKGNLAEFAGAVLEATAYRGMIPANLLYTAPETMAWWAPSARRRVWFKSSEKSIGTASVDVAHPPLVFVATTNAWFVFALRCNARPDPNTVLCKAPYFNVWERGQICTGNVALPAARGPEVMASYEEAFFRSHFTHPNDKGLVKYTGGAVPMWAAQIANPDEAIISDPQILIDTKLTLESTIKHIAKD